MITSFLNRRILYENNDVFRIRPTFVEKWLIERGGNLISTSSIDKNAIEKLKLKELECHVKDIDIVKLSKKWGAYRGERTSPENIRAWLNQFKNNTEKYLMFKLLQNIKFYDEALIREKIRVIHSMVRSKSVHHIGINERSRHDILLSSFGSPAKSGAIYARMYAQENEIIQKNIVNMNKIGEHIASNDKIKTIIFMDDIIGSGDTSIDLLNELNSSFGKYVSDNKIKIFICAICGLQKGIDELTKKVEKFNFEVFIEVTDIIYGTDIFTHAEFNILENQEDKDAAYRIVMDYGRKLDKKAPLGHDGCSLLVVFKDNCPDNTLSIIWDSSTSYPCLVPIFKRI